MSVNSKYEFDRQSIKDGIKMHDFPVNMIIETTSFCNLKCSMCAQPSMLRPKGNMEFRTFKKIADEVAEIRPETILWLDLFGEPLINVDNLISMIRYAKAIGLKDVRLSTNGLLLTKRVSELLVVSGLDYIAISVDAHSSRTYEKIRVGGDFRTLMHNIIQILHDRNRVESPLKIVTQFIVMEENEAEVDSFKKYWLDQGAVVRIRPKMSWRNTVKADNLNLTSKDRYPCPWLMREMPIHWTGKVAQCSFDYEGEYSPGDVNKQSIKEIWEETLERRTSHMAGDFSHLLCRDCKDWQVGRAIVFGDNNNG